MVSAWTLWMVHVEKVILNSMKSNQILVLSNLILNNGAVTYGKGDVNKQTNKQKPLTHLLQAAASPWTEGLSEPGCSKHHHTDTNQPGQPAERSHSLATLPKRTVHNRKRHFRMRQDLCNRVVKEKKLKKKTCISMKSVKKCVVSVLVFNVVSSESLTLPAQITGTSSISLLGRFSWVRAEAPQNSWNFTKEMKSDSTFIHTCKSKYTIIERLKSMGKIIGRGIK